MTSLHTKPLTISASAPTEVNRPKNEQGTEKNLSSTNNLEIAYSTISPKIEQPSQGYPMQIKLSLIDQNPYAHGSPNTSPYPMTPVTPNGSMSSEQSKKQKHNLREQRRILRISNQFDILRQKLEGVGYSSTKKDKFSVLQATLDYINQLERSQRGGGGVPTSSNVVSTSVPRPDRLTITAPSPRNDCPSPRLEQTHPSQHTFRFIDSMPSPVPALSGPNMQFPVDLDYNQTHGQPNTPSTPYNTPQLDVVEGSTASYRDVFVNSSMPSMLTKIDGTIQEANTLFLELCCKTIDELRLHSLYTMCTPADVSKMYSLVSKVVNCEMSTAQSKMRWHFPNSGDRKVFVSVSMVHDNYHRPANLHCSLLPLS